MNNNNAHASLENSPWFYVQKPVENPSLRLFCFSYAGGSASAYRDWCNQLPAQIEVCSVQLPGRGTRFREPSLTSMNLLLDAILPEISPYLGVPYAFFGHSMGAQVAFELTRRLRRDGEPLPMHLFVSGRSAPQINSTRKKIHGLPEVDFLEEIKKLNGTPEEALAHPELMELVSPILRADIQLIETWEYNDDQPLQVPITAMGGTNDDGVTARHLEGWGNQTSKAFSMQLFDGDHFFINGSRNAVLNRVGGTLAPIARSFGQIAYRPNRVAHYNHVA